VSVTSLPETVAPTGGLWGTGAEIDPDVGDSLPHEDKARRRIETAPSFQNLSINGVLTVEEMQMPTTTWALA
jgi:hypothetical protein